MKNGERMMNHPKSDQYKVHFERYKFARKYIANNNIVLDIASGSGYGTNYLSRYCKRIVGADVDREAVDYSRLKYKKRNVQFLLIDRSKRESGFVKSFDVVVSFETIEHVKDYSLFLNSLRSYLRPGGVLILSTPNNFSRRFPPDNPFHVYEFDIVELLGILRRKFPEASITMYGQVKTDLMRGEIRRVSIFRKLIGSLLKAAYDFDASSLRLLNRFERFSLYKRVGSLQRTYSKSFRIYRIGDATRFYNPEISFFVVRT